MIGQYQWISFEKICRDALSRAFCLKRSDKFGSNIISSEKNN